MTIVDLIPALKGHGRRRAQDCIRELKGEVAKLTEWQAAADDFFEQQDRNMRLLERELADEQRARAVAEADAEARGRWITDLERKLAEAERRLDVGVKAEHVIAQTQEIDVTTLHEAAATGRLGPVTDPGQIHTQEVL
jgi:hypothetical protein